jgi:hypothetical protein
MVSKNASFNLRCTDYSWKWPPLFCTHISARFKQNLFPFFDNFVSCPHAVSGPDDWLQSYSIAQNVETLDNDHSNVKVDNRACFGTAIFKLKVRYIIISWNMAHLLRSTLCVRATLQSMMTMAHLLRNTHCVRATLQCMKSMAHLLRNTLCVRATLQCMKTRAHLLRNTLCVRATLQCMKTMVHLLRNTLCVCATLQCMKTMAHLLRNTLCVRATLQCMKTNDRQRWKI